MENKFFGGTHAFLIKFSYTSMAWSGSTKACVISGGSLEPKVLYEYFTDLFIRIYADAGTGASRRRAN